MPAVCAIVNPMPREKGPPTKAIIVRLPVELDEPLKARAKAGDRSVSAHVVQLVKRDLALAERRAKRKGGE